MKSKAITHESTRSREVARDAANGDRLWEAPVDHLEDVEGVVALACICEKAGKSNQPFCLWNEA